MSEHKTDGMERPDLDAWNVTNNAGETQRVIVGEWFNSPQRIEIEPDGLIEDPDARSPETGTCLRADDE